ncbi:MAG TPA: MoaD/ThiS family protein [Anaeromyxobacter sp.]|nr:MoaD/ThiS family protein [Anaeromyxobacter sp.]
MRITFKLFATLGDYLPREHGGHVRVGNELPVDVPEGTTVQAVVDRFPMPKALVHLVLVNGDFVLPGERATRALRDGDVLAIWPPIAGG